MGPEVKELEEKLQDYTGAKHCITVASGTEALLISLMALCIEPGDEIITTPFTFVATAEVIVLLGASESLSVAEVCAGGDPDRRYVGRLPSIWQPFSTAWPAFANVIVEVVLPAVAAAAEVARAKMMVCMVLKVGEGVGVVVCRKLRLKI